MKTIIIIKWALLLIAAVAVVAAWAILDAGRSDPIPATIAAAVTVAAAAVAVAVDIKAKEAGR